MSVNGAKPDEDADMSECNGEKVVTMMDVLQEQQDFEEDANAVLGASDDKNCTYSKGYVKRQAIYACLTCCPEAKVDETKRAGVCLACSLNCHENHELVELYTKRNFRCDCGNPKFGSHKCQFTPNKTDLNYDNRYNQNFSGLYCNCHRPYPDPETAEEEEMIQCVICEDWLHENHLEATIPVNDQYSEMVCKACMEDNDFLHDYSDLVINVADKEIIITDPDLEVTIQDKLNTEVSKDETTSQDKPDEDGNKEQATENKQNKGLDEAEETSEDKTNSEDNKVDQSEDKPNGEEEKSEVTNGTIEQNNEKEAESQPKSNELSEERPDETNSKIDNIDAGNSKNNESGSGKEENSEIEQEKNPESEQKPESEEVSETQSVEAAVTTEPSKNNKDAADETKSLPNDKHTDNIEMNDTISAEHKSEEKHDKMDEVPEEKISENKRKHSPEEDEQQVKKPKLDEKKCVRPRGVKRVYKGATLWPATLRQKLCTCGECISMYKDLGVLFLIDLEDTVAAYEALGQEIAQGPSSQYEKGLQALSSLDRVQQINALTEYNKMKDKLLDFLKSFKDRKEIVKEEDIKAFFAGMKPKREPDGVYFCR